MEGCDEGRVQGGYGAGAVVESGVVEGEVLKSVVTAVL
jgi:hypothetical protein